jgi:hypothetical protein
MTDATPTEWSFDPLPSNATGWFAVIRCWDAAERMFPSTAWAEDSAFKDEPAVARDGCTGHAGPFLTEDEALRWGYDHDPEG